MSFYYEIIPIIIAFIRTDKVFHLRSYLKKKKERNLTRQTAKRKRKITFRFGENKKLRYIVKEFATEHASLRKGFADKETASDSPY